MHGLRIYVPPTPEPMPGPPPLSLPAAFREMVHLQRDPIGIMNRIHETHGPLTAMRGYGKSIIFAFGPRYNHILSSEPERFASKGFVIPGPRDSAQRRLATSLFTMNGTRHKHHRHLLLPAFQKSFLGAYRDDLVDILRPLLASWKPGAVIDVHREMLNWAWCIAGKLLYGLDVSPGAESLRHEFEYWLSLNASQVTRAMKVDWPLSPYRRLLKHAEYLEGKILAMLRTKEAANCQGQDVLSILMRGRHTPGQALTDGELVGHAMTLFLAAFETTANTLTWTLFLLDQHPNALMDALDELAPMRGEPPTMAQLNQLPMMERAIKESMRLLPAIPFSRRIAAFDGDLGGYFLPRSSRVIFSHYVTHHMPDLFREPNRFQPDRWVTIQPSPAEYLPFGAGAHMCIGSSFAMFVIKTTLAMILPRWRLSALSGARVDRKVVVSLGPKYGMPMIVAPQERQLQRNKVKGNIHEMVELLVEPARIIPIQSRKRAA